MISHSIHRMVREDDERSRVFGLVTAKVTKILDDNLYLVEYLHMGEGEASTRARVMMPMAGKKRGTYFLPLVDDEVVIAFEKGDTSFPIILGALWNENNAPPDQARSSPQNEVRTIVSRSGHEITLDDAAGREKVTVRSHAGQQVVLDDSGAGSITISTSAATIRIDNAGGTVSVQTPGTFSVNAGVIQLQAGVITVATTNDVFTSTIVMDGVPFGAHMHYPIAPPPLPGPPPPPLTGTVVKII